MPRNFEQTLISAWYQGSFWLWLLVPFSWLFIGVAKLRRLWYQKVNKTALLNTPVIVVGNITLGGTGKTPVVIALTQALKASGKRPGIVTRGYGSQSHTQPTWVESSSAAEEVGDEALLLERRTGCPTIVSPNRLLGAQKLIEDGCDIIISDDGLQHYRLPRHFEILVIDGLRRFGNGHCLPAGPLREPLSRLEEVDAIICQGAEPKIGEIGISYQASEAINIKTGERVPLSRFSQHKVHAVAGIGNPEKFFNTLQKLGIHFTPHAFSDHHAFQEEELAFTDQAPIIMTEKDAVKCEPFAQAHWWALPIDTQLPDALIERILETTT